MDKNKLTPCHYYNAAWIYASEYDYGSDYEAFEYTVNCNCGYAWRNRKWYDIKEEAINDWNSKV